MSDIGNSNRIAREYIDSLRIETRYMDATHPTLDFTLYGETFASPIMTAALSHLDHFMFPGAADALAQGARRRGGAVVRHGRGGGDRAPERHRRADDRDHQALCRPGHRV